MGMLLGTVFTILVMHGLLISPTYCSVYSSIDSAVRFSQCLVQNMNASSHFNVNDQDGMNDIANVMVISMRDVKRGPRESFQLKIFVFALVSSLADIVILEDPAANVPRRDAYFLALEQCALASTGSIDPEVLNEAFRVMNTFENVKISAEHGARAFDGGVVVSSGGKLINPQSDAAVPHEPFYPSEIQPSPVQSAFFSRDYSLREKTFVPPPDSAFVASSSSGISPTNMRSTSGVPAFRSLGGLKILQSDESFEPPSLKDFKVLHTDDSKGDTDGLKTSVPIPQSGVNMPSRGIPEGDAKELLVQTDNKNNPPLFQESFRNLQSSAGIPHHVVDTPFQDNHELEIEGIPFQSSGTAIIPQPQKEFGNLQPPAIVPQPREFFQNYSIPQKDEILVQPSSEMHSLTSTEDFGVSPQPLVIPSFPKSLSEANRDLEGEENTESTTAVNLPSSQKESDSSPQLDFISQSGIPDQDMVGKKEETPIQTFSDAELSPIPMDTPPLQEGLGNYSQPATVLQSSPASQKLSIAQTGEIPAEDSNRRIISPSQTNSEALSKTPTVVRSDISSEDQSVPERSQMDSQPSGAENPFTSRESFDGVEQLRSPSQVNAQIPDPSLGYSLESIILDILTNSPSFRDAFRSGINQRDAIALAIAITKQSLSGYDSKILLEALDSVTKAVSTVTYSSPENYAQAFANALSSILKTYNIPLFADGTSIASSMLTNLDSPKQDYNQQTNSSEEIVADYSSDVGIPSLWQQDNLPINFESPIMMPEDVNTEIFSNALSQKLTGSFRLANLFCVNNFTEDRMSIYFILMKTSLSDYGVQMSMVGATTVSEALIEIAEEALCSDYAKVISNILAEIFYENGILEQVSPEDILNKMELSLSYIHLTPKQTSFTESGEMSSTDSGLLLDIKHSQNGTDSDDLSVALQNQEKYSPDIDGDSFTDSYNSTLKPPLNEPTPAYENLEYYTSLYTTLSPAEISVQGYNEEIIATEAMPEIKETSTESPTAISSNYENLNKKQLVVDFLAEFDSLLESTTDKSAVVVNDNPEDADETVTQSSGTNCPRNSHQCKRRRKKKRPTTPQPGSEPSSDGETADSDEIALPDGSLASRGSQSQQDSPYIDQGSDKLFVPHSSEDYTEETTIPPVELQPSFQIPQSSDISTESTDHPASTDDKVDDRLSLLIAEAVSKISSSSIAFIRSGNFNMADLCGRLNKYAPIVEIPPNDNCEETAVIDYLLNVLQSVTKILKGV